MSFDDRQIEPTKPAAASLADIPGLPRAFAELMRLDKPTGWWLLLLPAWWSILLCGPGITHLPGYAWYLMFLFWVGAIVMRSAGCIVNDLWDRKLDAQVARTASRPLAAGTVKIWQAFMLLFVLLFLGLLILVQLSPLAIWIGVFSVILVVTYPLMKRITWWPQAFLGLTFNIGTLMGWAAVTGGMYWSALLLYAAGFFWTIGYDTIYACQDKEDDELVGIRSTARLFGDNVKYWVTLMFLLTILFWMLAIWTAAPTSAVATLMALPPGILLLGQVAFWKPESRESSWSNFAFNRDVGLLFALACALSFI